jgi:phosphatidylserine decarboxylase
MAKEGFYFFLPFVALMALFFFLFYYHPYMQYIYLAIASFIVGDLVLLFFRDPERKIPEGDDLIVSPADGRVLFVEKEENRYFISIFMSVLDVHINRVPVNGVVERLDYRPGKFKAAFKKEATDINERFEIEIKTDKGNVIMHQVAGLIARRVVCRLKKGQDVTKGQRLGLIRFGSRVDLFLPLTAQIEVKKGQKVKGAKSVIGRMA